MWATSLLAGVLLLAQGYVVPGRPSAAAPPAGCECDDWTSLEFWYDQADLPGSGSISAWSDSSVNSNHLSQGTGGDQPVVASLGTGSGAHFDGSGDHMDLFAEVCDVTNEYTIATVLYVDSLAGDSTPFGNEDNNGRAIGIESDGAVVMLGHTGGAENIIAAGGIPATTVLRLITGRNSGGDLWIYKDGVDVTNGTPDNTKDVCVTVVGFSNGGDDMDGIVGTSCYWSEDHIADVADIDACLDADH